MVVPGAQLGQYRVIEQVGRGGMATVYKAFQPSLNRYVAIKVLPTFYADDAEFLERFRQEAQTVSQLRHPNILAVFDFGEQDGVTYMVSEFLPGGTLADRLGQPLPVATAIELLGPIAAALDYAHRRGMIHRDVKPSNILLTADGTPVLSDFGVARMVGGTSRLTATGVAVGTPEYMAPEQAAGDPTTPAADRYALGIVLYELLTGRTPFQAETPVAVALAHLHKPLPLPRTLNATLSATVEALLLKALAKAPDDRFATAEEMIQALDAADRPPPGPTAVTLQLPVPGSVPASSPHREPAPETVIAPPERPVVGGRSRLGWLVGGAGLIFVLLVGGAVLFTRGPVAAPTARPEGAVTARPLASSAAGPASPFNTSQVAPTSVAEPAGSAVPSGPFAATKPGQLRGERVPLQQILPQLAARFSGAIERDDFSSPTDGMFTVPVTAPFGRGDYENGSLTIDYTRSGPSDPLAFQMRANRPVDFKNGVIDFGARVISPQLRAGFNVSLRRAAGDSGSPGAPDGYNVWFVPRLHLIQFGKITGAARTVLAQTQQANLLEASNRVIVVADGATFQIFVNGQQALTAQDGDYTSGLIGFAAGLGPEVQSGEARVLLDDLRVLTLQ